MKVNLRSVDLNLLTVFDAVMREGKLSDAAVKLGMTQPAASNAVSRLRLTFDDDLFIRTRQGMVPTPKAKELIGPIREALELIQGSLDPSSDFDPDVSERTFKLAIGDYGEIILLPALLSIFSQHQGALRIQTFPEMDKTSYELVKQAQIDFYFDYKPPVDEQLDFCQIGEEEVVVIARKGHPTITTKLSQKDYLDANHVILDFRHHDLTMLEDLLRVKKRIPRKAMAEVRQFVSVPELVTKTDCIATVPRKMAEYYSKRDEINIFPLPFKIDKGKAYMIWHKAMNRDKGHQWLKNNIIELAKLVD